MAKTGYGQGYKLIAVHRIEMSPSKDIFNTAAENKGLFLAALERDDAKTLDDLLIRQPFLLMQRHDNGEDALHIAVRGGKKACLDILLEWDADPNTQNDLGQTALHRAVKQGDLALFRRLQEKGGKPDLGDNLGITPADLLKMQLDEAEARIGLKRLIKKESLQKPDNNGEKPAKELKSRFLDPAFQKKLGKLFG